MTDQEIIAELKIEAARAEIQQAVINNFYTTIQLRLINILGGLLTAQDKQHLELMESQGAGKQEMLAWLGDNVADADELRRTLEKDYIEELKHKLQ